MKVNVKGTYFTSRALKNHYLTNKPEVDRALISECSIRFYWYLKLQLATKLLRHCTHSNRVTSDNKTIRTPPLPPPFKVGVFAVSIGSSNMGTTLHRGDRGGIFPPFEVSKT